MVAEKTKIYCAHALYRRGGTCSKTQTVIHAAECFWPSKVFMHAGSVWKHETGHKKGRWLQRKLRFIVPMHCTGEGPA
jgi:hypothetical protein